MIERRRIFIIKGKRNKRVRREKRLSRKILLKDLQQHPTPRDFFGYISTEKTGSKKRVLEKYVNSSKKELKETRENSILHLSREIVNHRRLCSVTARDINNPTLPSLHQHHKSYNNYDDTSSINASTKLIPRKIPTKKFSGNLSYLETMNSSKQQLSSSNTDMSLGDQHASSRTYTLGSRRRGSEHNNSIPAPEIVLPIINEYKYNFTMKEEANKSLFKSMRELQNEQNSEKISKEKLEVKLKDKIIRRAKSKKVNTKGSKDINVDICRYTKQKYIRDVYIKNKVPNIDKRKKRTRKISKLKRLNKSQIKVIKGSSTQKLDLSSCI
mmetsp:Transcript_7138/g.6332  ORF Transcript_7138/g.6332 Transcript_7138/m.6332 type:complete len:326 (-) Transcript_7138:87-1064(-)